MEFERYPPGRLTPDPLLYNRASMVPHHLTPRAATSSPVPDPGLLVPNHHHSLRSVHENHHTYHHPISRHSTSPLPQLNYFHLPIAEEETCSKPNHDPEPVDGYDVYAAAAAAAEEDAPIVDLRHAGYHTFDPVAYDPRRISHSSFASSNGVTFDAGSSAYDDLSSAEVISLASDYDGTHNGGGSGWASATHTPTLSPIVSPRLSNQHIDTSGVHPPKRSRSASRSRAPLLHQLSSVRAATAAAAPYPIDKRRPKKRWSTGAFATMPTSTPDSQLNAYNHHGLNHGQGLDERSESVGKANGGGMLSRASSLKANHRICEGGYSFCEEDHPELLATLRQEQIDPPESDMNPSDPDLVPRSQDPRFPGDLYTPRWVRGIGNRREAWCGLCKPGRWLVLKNSAFWYDRSFSHGICATTAVPFPPPVDTRRSQSTNAGAEAYEGRCGICQSWIALAGLNKRGTTWFRHAYKCHTQSKNKDSSRRRRPAECSTATGASASLAGSKSGRGHARSTSANPLPTSTSSSSSSAPITSFPSSLFTSQTLLPPMPPTTSSLLSSSLMPNVSSSAGMPSTTHTLNDRLPSFVFPQSSMDYYSHPTMHSQDVNQPQDYSHDDPYGHESQVGW